MADPAIYAAAGGLVKLWVSSLGSARRADRASTALLRLLGGHGRGRVHRALRAARCRADARPRRRRGAERLAPQGAFVRVDATDLRFRFPALRGRARRAADVAVARSGTRVRRLALRARARGEPHPDPPD